LNADENTENWRMSEVSFFYGLLGAVRGYAHTPASTGGRPPSRKGPCALLLRKSGKTLVSLFKHVPRGRSW